MTRWPILPLCLLLCACDDEREAELAQWIAQAREQTRPLPPQPVPVAQFQPFRYDGRGKDDPFDARKLQAGLSAGMQAEFEREREALEEWPLESLKMVGSVRRRGSMLGLVAADKLVFPVRPGSHIGQNLGKVVAIGERAIEIRELVQDANGKWSDRRAWLELQP